MKLILTTVLVSFAICLYSQTEGVGGFLIPGVPGGVATLNNLGLVTPAQLPAHSAGDYSANQIDFTPFGDITATDVQDAIFELYTEKLGIVVTSALLSGDGTSGSPLTLAQNGANPNDVLTWTGVTWQPAPPAPVTEVMDEFPLSPQIGDNLFHTGDAKFYKYDGSVWVSQVNLAKAAELNSNTDESFTKLTESKTYVYPTDAASINNNIREFINVSDGFVSLDPTDVISTTTNFVLAPRAAAKFIFDASFSEWLLLSLSNNVYFTRPSTNAAISVNTFGTIGLKTDTLPVGWYELEASVAYNVDATTTGIGTKSTFTGSSDSGNGCYRIWNYNNAASGWKEADTNLVGGSVIETGGTNGSSGHVRFGCVFHVNVPGVYEIEMGAEAGGTGNINAPGSFIKLTPLNRPN